jgi:cytochrome c-type biogenesis protein CcmH/NrfG
VRGKFVIAVVVCATAYMLLKAYMQWAAAQQAAALATARYVAAQQHEIAEDQKTAAEWMGVGTGVAGVAGALARVFTFGLAR